MQRTSRIICNIEPQLEETFRSLATKKGMSPSKLIRSMIIDELRMQGTLPAEAGYALLKGHTQPN